MTRYHGRHRKPTTSGRTVAKVAITGMVVGAPLAVFAAPASAASADQWAAVAQCESGGNPTTNTGNGFSGAYQFTPSTWSAYGGQGAAQNASLSEQTAVAERVLAGQGKGAWPVCGTGLGSASPSSAKTESSPVQQQAPAEQYTAPTQQAPVQQYTAPTQQAPAQQYTAPTQQAPAQQYTAPTQQAPAQQYTAPTQQAPAQQYSAPQSTPGGTYTVQSGDTLSNIATANNVAGGYQAIAAANPIAITDVNLIYPGQILKLG